jgi:hypothetical protein
VNRNAILLTISCVACSAAVSPSATGVESAARPTARITRTLARFTFPAEPRDSLTWDLPDSNGYLGSPQYAWTVEWEPEWSMRGTAPRALWLVTYWRPGGPRHGALARMVQDWSVGVMTEDLESDGTYIGEPDSAVNATVVNGHIELSVTGESAIRRIFPVAPDSVWLYCRLGPDAPEEDIAVPVR